MFLRGHFDDFKCFNFRALVVTNIVGIIIDILRYLFDEIDIILHQCFLFTTLPP